MNRWFLFFFYRAITQRKIQFFLATLAVILAVTPVTAFIAVSWGVPEIMGKTLQDYGANMVVTACTGQELSMETISRLKKIAYIQRIVPYIYGNVATTKSNVEIIGTDMSDLPEWRITGKLPQKIDEVIAGRHLQAILGIDTGKTIVLGNQTFTVTALLESGSDEDNAIVMTASAAQKLTGKPGYSALLLFADSHKLADVEADIAHLFPGLEIKTLRQIVVAEEKILGKIQLLISSVGLGVLLTAAITLASTTSASVLERAQEIALMKTMGATSQTVGSFFLAEAGIYTFIGSLVGFLAGILMAQIVAISAFGSLLPVFPWIFILSLMTGTIITLVSTFFPVWEAMRLSPATILRGL